MGAPIPEMEPVENASAEALLSSLPTISAAERRKHASVFNYWHSIRGDRQFPPIRDLDPLEITDAGPSSVLLEMIGGGDDAIVRHLGQAIKLDLEVEKIGEAPLPSLLSCIHAKLPIVAACRQSFAFEESFETNDGPRRCWVSLLPFSENGTWIDFVYGFVSLDPGEDAEVADEDEPEAVENLAEPADEAPEAEEAAVDPDAVPLRPFFDEAQPLETSDAVPATVDTALTEPDSAPEPATYESQSGPELVDQPFEPVAVEPEAEAAPQVEVAAAKEPEPELASADESPATRPGFSAKLFEKLGNVAGFYGQGVEAPPLAAAEVEANTGVEIAGDTQGEAEVAPDVEPEAKSDPAECASKMEGSLENKLSEVRAMAEEARQARLRSVAALVEGLSAAYDFAVDAEQAPEEYLKLVEAQGLKIQLRAPMKPVVKLAFDESWDNETIAELEAVLAWALKMELPRGSLADRIEAEGGLGNILEGLGRAA